MDGTYQESPIFSDGQLAQWRIFCYKLIVAPQKMLEWLEAHQSGEVVGHAWHTHDAVTAEFLNSCRHNAPFGVVIPVPFRAGENHIHLYFESNSLKVEGQPVGPTRSDQNWLYLTGSAERMLPHPLWVKQFEYRLDQFFAGSEASASCTCGGTDCKLRSEVAFPVTREVAIAELWRVTRGKMPIYSAGHDGIYLLVSTSDSMPAVEDQTLNGKWILKGGSAPHKPGSSGEIHVEEEGRIREFYAQTGGLTWLKVREP